jgi:putative aldouronate transport system permease protein
MNHYWNETWKTKLFDIFNFIILLIFTLIVIYPLWLELMISLNDPSQKPIGEVVFWTQYMTLDAYKILFKDSNILRGTIISILRVVIGTTCTLFCTGLLAYVTTIRRFKGRNFLRKVYIITMYFSGGLIPTYLLMVNLKLTNTFWVYIIPCLFSAYYMLLIASYIQSIPEALFEAARIDGCSELGIYAKIVLPVCVPVFAAVAVYLAVGHWNSWFDVLIYNPKGQWDTLQVYLRRILLESEAAAKVSEVSNAESKLRNMTSESVRAATTIVVTVPILLVYPFFQKYFISGITIGSVKQ